MNTNTNTTITLNTTGSTAVSTIAWTGDVRYASSLFVTYKSGATYRFDGVRFADVVELLEAADNGRSIGGTLHLIISAHDLDGVRVAA